VQAPFNEKHAVLNSHDVGTVKLKRRKILWCDAEYARLFGCTPAEQFGKSTNVLCQFEASLNASRSASNSQFEQGEVVKLQLQIRHKDGTLGWYESSGERLERIGDETIWSLVDITERKCHEERSQQLAFYDALTNLPNRRLLNDRLSLAIDTTKRQRRHGALMMIDLDAFKPINDSEGHEAGDRFLVEIGQRLTSHVRKMDTVARIGGDEFVVLITDLEANRQQATSQAATIAEKIRHALEAPFLLDQEDKSQGTKPLYVHCAASIGVVMFPTNHSDRNDLINLADLAMYRAKEAGGNRVEFYNPPA